MATVCCELATKQRKSAKLVHAVTLVIGYTQLTIYFIASIKFAHDVIKLEWSQDDFDIIDYEYDEFESPKLRNYWFQWIFLLFSLIGLLSSWNLLCGVKRKNSDLLLPWFIFHMLFIYFNILSKMILYVIRSTHPWLFGILVLLENCFYGSLMFIVYLQYRSFTVDRTAQPQKESCTELGNM